MESAPLDSTSVQVTYEGPHRERYVANAFHLYGEWIIDFQVERVKPIAWMPKPEPYDGD